MKKLSAKQLLLMGIALAGWAMVYLNQDFDVTYGKYIFNQYSQGSIPENGEWRFVINKSLRFILNDLFSVLFIYGLFQSRAYVRTAFLVMGFGLFVLLPLYLTLALIYRTEGFNMLVFLHRITMNPWLMILLIPAFYYMETEKVQEKATDGSSQQ
jgi:exosortase F-associated protein